MNRLRAWFKRNQLTIAVGLMFAVQIASVLLVLDVLHTAHHASADRTKQITKLEKQLVASQQDLDRHMDCIVQFFALPERQNKTINDIETCRISNQKIDLSGSQPASARSTTQAQNKAAVTSTGSAGGGGIRSPSPAQSSFVTQLLQPVVSPVTTLYNQLNQLLRANL